MRMKNKSTPEAPMKGQQKYTCGIELRWVMGRGEVNVPAKIYDRNYKVVYSGDYEAAIKWLEARGLTPV